MLLSVAEVVFQLIPLILQGVERLILDLPARATAAHDQPHGVLAQLQVRYPTAVKRDLSIADFPVFQDVHQHVRIRLIQGDLIQPAKMVDGVVGGVRPGDRLAFTCRERRFHLLEEELMVPGLAPRMNRMLWPLSERTNGALAVKPSPVAMTGKRG